MRSTFSDIEQKASVKTSVKMITNYKLEENINEMAGMISVVPALLIHLILNLKRLLESFKDENKFSKCNKGRCSNRACHNTCRPTMARPCTIYGLPNKWRETNYKGLRLSTYPHYRPYHGVTHTLAVEVPDESIQRTSNRTSTAESVRQRDVHRSCRDGHCL